MPLGPGSRIGPYEVTALLGTGGMGEVWRARHTVLKRDDALKVLPKEFAADPERLARFHREAQVLASLSHPNIAHVYGLEESSHSASSGHAGVQALVMELVEGPTLADRIAQGPIALDEALPIAKQIAEALEAAHEQGIIHRDLKPANIKVRPDGTVKVLDFGLARIMDPLGGTSPDMSQSPTITSPAMTGVGMLLGTAAYMSPEQAKGRAADRRSDIWAFGCVLYEMLAARRGHGDPGLHHHERARLERASARHAHGDSQAPAPIARKGRETPPARYRRRTPRNRRGRWAADTYHSDPSFSSRRSLCRAVEDRHRAGERCRGGDGWRVLKQRHLESLFRSFRAHRRSSPIHDCTAAKHEPGR
jgi:serine/threonine protein kinase